MFRVAGPARQARRVEMIHTKIIKMLMPIMLLFCLVAGVSANTSNDAADYLANLGKKYYDGGQIDEAIHEFSKALIVDPNNVLAKKYLNKLGLSQGLYSPAKTTTTQIADLTKNIRKYQQKVTTLEKKNGEVASKLDQTEKEKEKYLQSNELNSLTADTLQKKTATIKEKSAKEKEQFNKGIKQVAEIYSERQDKLIGEKTELEKQIAFINQKEEKLSKLKEKFDSAILQSLTYENQLSALSHKYDLLKTDFSKQYAYQDKLINVLEEYLDIREQHLEGVSDNLVYKQFTLVQHDNLLISKLDELVELNESVDRYRSKIDEAQESISQKNDNIQTLAAQLDSEMASLDKTKELMQKQEENLQDLTQQLKEAKENITKLLNEKEKDLKRMQQEIDELKVN
jgi:chromosome segregation ATPase